ncbi:MAG TPA: potassium channel family protein [Bacteroidales bacterium]|nr:potassium channel family protein [Bacteroidales bacterium]HRZ20172.1 potassium channel family protein [Bacteroidales bacterium]
MSLITKLLQNKQYWILFISLLALILLPAFMSTLFFTNLLFKIILSVVFFTSVSAVMTGKRLILYGVFLAFVVIVLEWISFLFKDEQNLILTTQILYLAFFSYIIHRLFLVIVKSKEVTVDVIVVSVSIYLIMGIIFAILCSTFNTIYEGAYSITVEAGSHIYDFLYYCFITIATVGYGDIVPKIPQTQALAVLMGINGQLYMTIIVAVLVGKFLQRSSESK